jgi:hypothetical protein
VRGSRQRRESISRKENSAPIKKDSNCTSVRLLFYWLFAETFVFLAAFVITRISPSAVEVMLNPFPKLSETPTSLPLYFINAEFATFWVVSVDVWLVVLVILYASFAEFHVE